MTIAKLKVAAALAAATCALAVAAAGCARSGAGVGEASNPDGASGLGAVRAESPAESPAESLAASPAPEKTRPAGKDPTPSRAPTASSPSPSGPRIVYFRVKQKPQCPQGTNLYPVPGVPVVIEWKVSGAHEVALSVDSPNMVGSYGRYATEGSETFTFGCGGAPNTVEKHTYTIYTVGGGTQRHKSVTAEAKVYEISTV